MRQTLYQRLTPECVEAVEYNSKRWQGTNDKIGRAIQSHKLWSELKVGDVKVVIQFVDLPFAKITSGTYAFGENIIKDEE